MGWSKAGPTVTVTRLQDVEPKPLDWLWEGRIPLGKVTILAGDPGLGKSYTSLDIAARVSEGGAWPDGGNAPLGNVVIISAEDGLEDGGTELDETPDDFGGLDDEAPVVDG